MTWSDVRLQVDLPNGWERLDGVQPLTFRSSGGLKLRLTPLQFPSELRPGVSEGPLLRWALETTNRQGHFDRASDTQVSACRFGLCASLTFAAAPRQGARVQLFFLASETHAMLVSLQGTPSRDELAGALKCVENIRLVPAAQYPN